MNPQKFPDQKNTQAFLILEKLVEKYKTNSAFIIGITGAGGAGKTTFANNIVHYYGYESCVSIDLDDYLISREERGKIGITGYNPLANKLMLARQNISDLICGKEIKKPKYNHSTGKVLESEKVSPKPIIVIEGVTTLYPELADLSNISFYLDAPETTQIKSRLERDVKKRGYTIDQTMNLINALRPDFQKYIEPCKNIATVVFEVGTDYIMRPVIVKGATV